MYRIINLFRKAVQIPFCPPPDSVSGSSTSSSSSSLYPSSTTSNVYPNGAREQRPPLQRIYSNTDSSNSFCTTLSHINIICTNFRYYSPATSTSAQSATISTYHPSKTRGTKHAPAAIQHPDELCAHYVRHHVCALASHDSSAQHTDLRAL